MRIVLIGGHLSPLLSVLQELKKQKEIEMLVIGRKYALEGDKALSLEYQTIIDLGVNFKAIKTGRLQRKWTRYTLLSLLKFPYGLIQSYLILKKFRPNIILSFGGYVALPVVLVGFILKIPIIIHEQTLGAGFSNRIASFLAKRVLISWESSRKFFPKRKTILVGNPLRPEIINSSQFSPFNFQNDKKLPIICIMGGSLGSHAINLLVEGCIKNLLKQYIVFHQTGDAKQYRDFDRLQKLRDDLEKEYQKRYFLTKFIHAEKIGSILRKADLMISRSGINIVTELIYLGKPAIFIPLPFSQNHEQLENALFFKKLGLGEILNQEKITANQLCALINLMNKNLERYKSNAKEAKKVIKEDAVDKIMQVLKEEAKH